MERISIPAKPAGVPLSRRVLYFGYFILHSKYRRLRRQAAIVRSMHPRLRGAAIWVDMAMCSLRHGASFHEYFDLRHFELTPGQREEVLTTGLLHEFHRANNAFAHVTVFRDKAKFHGRFSRFTGRSVCNLDETSREEAIRWIEARREIIAKPRVGTIGTGVAKITVADRGAVATWHYLRSTSANLVVDVISQH